MISNYPGIKFINIKDEDNFIKEKPVLYKYLPLENALRNLKSKSIWLANPKKWEDPFEYRFLNAEYTDKKGLKSYFPYKERTFATCLTREPSSEAQWNAYSKDSLAIRFSIDTKILLEQLSNYAINNKLHVVLGNVEYHKRKDITVDSLERLMFNEEKDGTKINKNLKDIDFCARLVLLKRRDFSYEKEVRIIVFKDKSIKADGILFNYECDNKTLIKQLMISPKVNDSTFDMLKKYLADEFDMPPIIYKSGKKQSRIIRSRLYDKEDNVKISIF